MISTLVMTRLGLVRDGQMIAMKPGNAKLRERYAAIHGGKHGLVAHADTAGDVQIAAIHMHRRQNALKIGDSAG